MKYSNLNTLPPHWLKRASQNAPNAIRCLQFESSANSKGESGKMWRRSILAKLQKPRSKFWIDVWPEKQSRARTVNKLTGSMF